MLELDETLERFHMTQPEYLGGLANHGPMAIEALIQLGHRALTQGFLDLYVPRLPPLTPGRPLEPEEEAQALGDPSRFPDWLATLERELEHRSASDVVQRRSAAWLDGLFASAGHAWIRTAHALRALDREETPARRRELAHALAYWAARHQTLPGSPGEQPVAGQAPAAVLRAVPTLPREQRVAGSFTRAVEPLDGFAPFAAAIGSLDLGDAASEASGASSPARWETHLHTLCVMAARLYLESPEQRIAYIHVLTVPSALRLIAPHIEPHTRVHALARVTQAAAALHAIAAPGVAEPSAADPSSRGNEAEDDAALAASLPSEVLELAESRDELRYRAACSLEEHAIKFVEACLREDRIQPNPWLRRAAADAALRLAGKQSLC